MKLAREPLGLLANALPTYYLSKAADGGLLVMRDGSTDPNGATGQQRCLAHIPKDVLEELLAAKEPQGLRL